MFYLQFFLWIYSSFKIWTWGCAIEVHPSDRSVSDCQETLFGSLSVKRSIIVGLTSLWIPEYTKYTPLWVGVCLVDSRNNRCASRPDVRGSWCWASHFHRWSLSWSTNWTSSWVRAVETTSTDSSSTPCKSQTRFSAGLPKEIDPRNLLRTTLPLLACLTNDNPQSRQRAEWPHPTTRYAYERWNCFTNKKPGVVQLTMKDVQLCFWKINAPIKKV